MAYLARELVTFGYYLSGLVARDLETVTGSQISAGLERLNAMLSIATSQIGLIPYFKEYNFVAEPAKQDYEIANLVEIETMTFNINSVRYSMREASRDEFFGAPRVDNITSLPYIYHMERSKGIATVSVFYLPQEAYPMKLWGKFALQDVTLDTDLSEVYEGYYLEYLRYKFTDVLCDFYNVEMPAKTKSTLIAYEKSLKNVIPQDLSMVKLSSFSASAPFNYADANIGRGWRPSY